MNQQLTPHEQFFLKYYYKKPERRTPPPKYPIKDSLSSSSRSSLSLVSHLSEEAMADGHSFNNISLSGRGGTVRPSLSLSASLKLRRRFLFSEDFHSLSHISACSETLISYSCSRRSLDYETNVWFSIQQRIFLFFTSYGSSKCENGY